MTHWPWSPQASWSSSWNWSYFDDDDDHQRPVLSRGETIDSCCSEDLDLVTVLEVCHHNIIIIIIIVVVIIVTQHFSLLSNCHYICNLVYQPLNNLFSLMFSVVNHKNSRHIWPQNQLLKIFHHQEQFPTLFEKECFLVSAKIHSRKKWFFLEREFGGKNFFFLTKSMISLALVSLKVSSKFLIFLPQMGTDLSCCNPPFWHFFQNSYKILKKKKAGNGFLNYRFFPTMATSSQISRQRCPQPSLVKVGRWDKLTWNCEKNRQLEILGINLSFSTKQLTLTSSEPFFWCCGMVQ